MNQVFSIYNLLTKEITSKIVCSKEMVELQTQEDEGYIIGYEDPLTHRINDTEDGFIELSDTEKEDQLYLKRENTKPTLLDVSLSDTELNEVIEDYFLNRVDAETWRKSNYSYLREKAYPDETEYKTDAEIKIGSGIPEYVEAGELQLQQYYEDCINVKIRFPKE
jgi:hypothetical protein